MSKTAKIAATIVAATLVAGLAVQAFAGPSAAPSSAPSSAPSGTERAGRAGRGLRFLHADGQAMRGDGSIVDVHAQKGIIEAVDAHSITLKSADGVVTTYAIDDQTRIREEGKRGSVSDLKKGDMARVLAVKTADGFTARRISCLGEPGAALQQQANAA